LVHGGNSTVKMGVVEQKPVIGSGTSKNRSPNQQFYKDPTSWPKLAILYLLAIKNKPQRSERAEGEP